MRGARLVPRCRTPRAAPGRDRRRCAADRSARAPPACRGRRRSGAARDREAAAAARRGRGSCRSPASPWLAVRARSIAQSAINADEQSVLDCKSLRTSTQSCADRNVRLSWTRPPSRQLLLHRQPAASDCAAGSTRRPTSTRATGASQGDESGRSSRRSVEKPRRVGARGDEDARGDAVASFDPRRQRVDVVVGCRSRRTAASSGSRRARRARSSDRASTRRRRRAPAARTCPDLRSRRRHAAASHAPRAADAPMIRPATGRAATRAGDLLAAVVVADPRVRTACRW